MKLHILKFIDLIRKCTVNYCNDYCQLKVNKNYVKCNITNSSKNIISKFNLKNDFFSDLDESEIELNFIDSETNVIPYLQMFTNEEIDVKYDINRGNLVKSLSLKEKETKISTKLNLVEPIVTRVFSQQNVKNETKFIHTFELDKDFLDKFNKIKKIAVRTNKIYLVYDKKENMFYLEAGDKSIAFINSVKIELTEGNNSDLTDFWLCFEYKNFVSLISILTEEKKYEINLAYKKDKNIGLLYLKSNDLSEEYYLLSKID